MNEKVKKWIIKAMEDYKTLRMNLNSQKKK